ncbi:MAG: hypothetical protein DIU68_010285 [Chloroflexota bacterium]
MHLSALIASAEEREQLEQTWLTFFPAYAIALTVFGLNLVGDGLRHLLDPRNH